MNIEPPDRIDAILLIIGLIIAIGLSYLILAPKTPVDPLVGAFSEGYGIIEDNSLRAYPVPYTLKPMIFGTIVDCLSWEETKNSPYAMGKAGEIGILQFMPSTFQMYCVDKYQLRNNIWDVEIQKRCCDYMISDGLIHHWTTAKYCL